MTVPGPLSRDDQRLLAEIGFLAVHNGQVPAARLIFESLRVLRPESALPWIGLACVAIESRQPLEAVRLLEEDALKAHPGDAELKAFLGLALVQAGLLVRAARVLPDIACDGPEAAPHERMAAKLLSGVAGRRFDSVKTERRAFVAARKKESVHGD